MDRDRATLERDPRATLRHVEGIGDTQDAGLERQRFPVGAVTRDRLERLGDDDRQLGLVVDAGEELCVFGSARKRLQSS